MSPVFFVGKKDRSKRMVMDYYNLNNQTVKNNYPLSLITDLIDNMGSKQVFTKMDLQWGFNNIRIKEGDEWKGAFTTHVGSFEPTVIFFGMMNSPATFQAMMNEILRDMINEGKVAAFVDDVLVGTETEEGHDEIVEEVRRERLVRQAGEVHMESKEDWIPGCSHRTWQNRDGEREGR